MSTNIFSELTFRIRTYLADFDSTDVPHFETYYPSVNEMTDKQKKFYDFWKWNWQKGRALPINDQISYVYCYMYELISEMIPETIYPDYSKIVLKNPDYGIEEFIRISNKYSHYSKLKNSALNWATDICVMNEKYNRGIDLLTTNEPQNETPLQVNKILNMKYETERPLRGRDIVGLFYLDVTDKIRDRIDEIDKYLDEVLKQKRQKEGPILDQWVEMTNQEQNQYAVFNATPYSGYMDLKMNDFRRSEEIENFVKKITRQAENNLRNDLGIPEVGKYWVSETKLYEYVNEFLEDINVIQHASPDWLSPQHLDIYIPSQDLAIEYQGRQHYEPVDFFGGQESYEDQKKRDKRKENLCSENEVELFEWKFDKKINAKSVKEFLEKKLDL